MAMNTISVMPMTLIQEACDRCWRENGYTATPKTIAAMTGLDLAAVRILTEELCRIGLLYRVGGQPIAYRKA